MRKIAVIVALLVVTLSCGKKVKNVPLHTELIGLASPIQLDIDSTNVILTDYFVEPNIITNIVVPQTIQLTKDSIHSIIKLRYDNKKLKLYETMTIKTNNGEYSILLKNSKKQKIILQYKSENKKNQKVQIAGDVNNWNPTQSNFVNNKDTWSLTMLLNPGKYHYQLVVDGKWILDPENPVIEDNNIGGQNSVLNIPSPNPKDLPYLYVKKSFGNKISLGFDNCPDNIYVFWENHCLTPDFINIDTNNIKITIPENAKKIKRSHIRVWSSNSFGNSNDLFIPLDNGEMVTSYSQLNRSDKHTQILYFLMIDRFYNGNPENDQPVKDPEILPKANYMGGDLAGITAKIHEGYFSKLGINTIWLSPITQNPIDAWGLWLTPRSKFSGYHGYWPVSLTKVDFRFGTKDELNKLLKIAHDLEMNVLLDYVANHVHKYHPVIKQHPDWSTPLYLPDGTMNLEKWDEHRLTTWFDTFLPTLDLERPEVYETMTDSALFWVTEFDFDGFRHDATKHIPEVFWRKLTQKIKTAIPNKSIYQIGETYGSRELIGSYIGSGMMDAQFDFNLYDQAVATFAKSNSDFVNLNSSVLESMNQYGSLHLMGNMSGNQDKPRFISLASGDVRFDEDAKLAGWTRKIEVTDTLAYRKLVLMNIFNLTIPGIPTIYYGDEIGMPGANDPDNRRMMKFGELNKYEEQTLNTVTKWIHMRRELLPLQYGTFKPLLADKDIYVFARQYAETTVVVAFNKSKEVKNITVKLLANMSKTTITKEYNIKYIQENDIVNIVVEPLSCGLLVFE